MIRIVAAMIAALSLATAMAVAAGSPSTPSPKPSPSPAPPGASTLSVGVWTIHTDSDDANWHTGDFSMPSKLTMTRDGGDISADRASGNYKTQIATLYGHVVMHDVNGNMSGIASAPGHSQGPATLTADQVNINGKVYTATGNVHYVQNDTTVDSDKGTLNDLTHDLHLVGNVHVVQGQRKMDAAAVDYNTITGNAHMDGGVTMQFPSAVHTYIATPRPLYFGRHGKRKSQPSPAATASP